MFEGDIYGENKAGEKQKFSQIELNIDSMQSLQK